MSSDFNNLGQLSAQLKQSLWQQQTAFLLEELQDLTKMHGQERVWEWVLRVLDGGRQGMKGSMAQGAFTNPGAPSQAQDLTSWQGLLVACWLGSLLVGHKNSSQQTRQRCHNCLGEVWRGEPEGLLALAYGSTPRPYPVTVFPRKRVQETAPRLRQQGTRW